MLCSLGNWAGLDHPPLLVARGSGGSQRREGSSHVHCSDFCVCHRDRDLFFIYGINWEPLLAACSLPNKVDGSGVDYCNLSPVSCWCKMGLNQKSHIQDFPKLWKGWNSKAKGLINGFCSAARAVAVGGWRAEIIWDKSMKKSVLELMAQSALNLWENPSWAGHQCQHLQRATRSCQPFSCDSFSARGAWAQCSPSLGPSSIPRLEFGWVHSFDRGSPGRGAALITTCFLPHSAGEITSCIIFFHVNISHFRNAK